MSTFKGKCRSCGTLAVAEDGTITKLFRCGKCRTIQYCKRACQKQDHQRHKQECGAFVAAREEKRKQRTERREARQLQTQQRSSNMARRRVEVRQFMRRRRIHKTHRMIHPPPHLKHPILQWRKQRTKPEVALQQIMCRLVKLSHTTE